MRVFGRRYVERTIGIGSDQVIIGYPIPAGGTLKNVWFNIHLIGAEGVVFKTAVSYGISGFVVPILDPDAAPSYTTVWDTLVPKDINDAAGLFDLDTAAADTKPEFEMGEADIQALFDLTPHKPVEVYRRRKFLTIANAMANYEIKSAADDLWTPAEFINGQIKRNVSVKTPSVFMLGVSSPSLDQTSTTDPLTPSEVQWAQYQYLEMTLEQAFINLLGLVETGAETPWEEASTFISDLIESVAFEEDAGAFHPMAWRCFCNSTIEVSVPGRKNMNVISSE